MMNSCTSFTTGLCECMVTHVWVIQAVSSSAEVASVVRFCRVLSDYISDDDCTKTVQSFSFSSVPCGWSDSDVSTIEPLSWLNNFCGGKRESYEATLRSWGFQLNELKWKCVGVRVCSVALGGWIVNMNRRWHCEIAHFMRPWCYSQRCGTNQNLRKWTTLFFPKLVIC